MTTREAVIKAVAVLTTAYNRESSATLTQAYQLALSDLSGDEVAAAMKRALAASKFMPTPAELLAFAGRAPRDTAAEATLAWDAVRRAMDALDVYGNPDFGPLVNAVVRNLGGWLYLCEQKVSDLEWRRKDFERVYRLWAEKPAEVIPDGAPLMGQWKHAPITRIEIAGLPLQQRALAAPRTQDGEAVAEVVRELAEAKSQPGEALPGRSVPTVGLAGQPAAPPLREVKPKAPPMTAADVEARKEQICEQMASRLAPLPADGATP